MHCLGCNYKSNTYEDTSALSLDIPQTQGGFGKPKSTNFEQCLNNFCKVEVLKGQNKYSCGKCNRKCEAKKRFTIEKSPRVLLIHLKRFTNFGTKIKDFIKYPKSFSLRGLMSSTVDGNNGQGQRQQGQESEMFDLFGVVVHQGGGCRSGHYYSYVKGVDN